MLFSDNIIFSHGLGGNRTQNTVIMEELASHGYVVIAIEHAYDANISIFNNGDIADYRSGINYERKDEAEDLTPEEFWEIRLPQLKTRAADVSFLIDVLSEKPLETLLNSSCNLSTNRYNKTPTTPSTKYQNIAAKICL